MFLSKHISLYALGRIRWILNIIWPLNQHFRLKKTKKLAKTSLNVKILECDWLHPCALNEETYFSNVDVWPKIYLFLYPSLETLTTHIAIQCNAHFGLLLPVRSMPPTKAMIRLGLLLGLPFPILLSDECCGSFPFWFPFCSIEPFGGWDFSSSWPDCREWVVLIRLSHLKSYFWE